MLPLLSLLLGCGSSPAERDRPKGLHRLGTGLLLAELESRRARPRVYNFWATWCGPCMAELPALKAFGEAHPHVDLVFVNVDVPSLHETKVKATVQRFDLGAFEHLALDDPDPAYALNQVDGWPNSIPVTLVVSSKGKRVRQFNTRVDEGTLARAVQGVP